MAEEERATTFGFCEPGFHVRWLVEVRRTDEKGNVFGICASCERELREGGAEIECICRIDSGKQPAEREAMRQRHGVRLHSPYCAVGKRERELGRPLTDAERGLGARS